MKNSFAPSAQAVGALAAALLWHPASQATLKDDIGYTELATLLGASLPNGAVTVFQIEATQSDPVGCNPLDPPCNRNWIADASEAQFTGKTITGLGSPPSSAPSGHATFVGLYFYGNLTSISPGITDIGAHSFSSWITQHLWPGYPNNGAFPIVSNRRISNHSYVAGMLSESNGTPREDWTSTTLRYADYVSDADEMVQVYGTLTTTAPNNRVLMATALNGITAGIINATNANEVVPLDDIYVAGRPELHLVTPVDVSSKSTPVIASAAAILIDAAQQNPSWSDSFTTNRFGTVIRNAERAETIKAALMAGARRYTNNSTSQGDITDYRQQSVNQTDNGLDGRYGAGQLNILKSYQILAMGESASMEDDIESSNLGFTGFDHDASFGGDGGSNILATYDLGTTNDKTDLSVSLVWNLSVTGTPTQGNPNIFDETAVLHNLDLELVDVTNGNQVVAASGSSIDNTENIWHRLDQLTHYELRVTRASGQADFSWDYSIAWSETPVPGTNIPFPAWALGVLGLCLVCVRVRIANHSQ